ncbi:MAG: E3 binding domain-containing protein, partial [Gammaproteobacteria bacterium]|nr:E3 binding domain-containing protein [Gammaproteobacteria bacterium]
MPVEVIMPKVDMDMAQGTIAQWHKQEGDTVTQGDPLFDIETDKATMEVEAPASGILRQVSAGDGAQVDIGTCIAHIYADGEELIEPTKPASSVVHTLPLSSGQTPAESTHLADHSSRDDEEVREDSQSDAGIRATPLARRIARQQGITLASVTGTGPRGRITRQDIELHGRAKTAEPLAVVPPSVASTERLDALGIDYTAQPVSRMRAAIADRLTLSKSSVPHFYLERDCQVDKLKSYRQDLNDALVSGDAARISLNDL